MQYFSSSAMMLALSLCEPATWRYDAPEQRSKAECTALRDRSLRSCAATLFLHCGIAAFCRG